MTNVPPDSRQAQEQIERGLAALKQGDRATARTLLGQVVRLAPSDERAWLGLAATFTEPDRRRYCIERCLTLNPNNITARRALDAITEEERRERTQPSLEPGSSSPPTPTAPTTVPLTRIAPVEAPPAWSAPEKTTAPAVASPAPEVPAPAITPLAARLAAAEAKRVSQQEPTTGSEGGGRASQIGLGLGTDVGVKRDSGAGRDTPILTPLNVAPGDGQATKHGSRGGRASQTRVRRQSEPPLLLQPVQLSEAVPALTAPTTEEVAQVALQQLLSQGEGGTAGERTSSAATIAQRYFRSSRPSRPARTPDQALRALGMHDQVSRRVRLVRLVGALAVVSILAVLLFGALLRM
ncbi:MAG: hypothetical protein RLZZ387_3279 [Chloroflexota bacterium]|jgi:hypothetical protein